MPENLEQKSLTKVVKVCIKITPDFVSKEQMDVKRGIMVLKWGQNVSRPMYTGFSRFGPALAGFGQMRRGAVKLGGDVLRKRRWSRCERGTGVLAS
jgi:hypothetical protein